MSEETGRESGVGMERAHWKHDVIQMYVFPMYFGAGDTESWMSSSWSVSFSPA